MVEIKKARTLAGLSIYIAVTLRAYRFENWKLLRAFALPYFLRSSGRLSRVMKPPDLGS
jgi:hypothetical protein